MGNITQLHQGSLNGLRKQTNECLENAYNKGYEDGKKDFEVSNGQAEYNKGCNKGLEEFEKLYINEYDYKDFFKSYDNEDIQNWELYDLVAKYGAKKVVNDFNKWQEEKKKVEEINDHHFIVDSLRNMIDDYGVEKVANALIEFGIEVNNV